MFVTWVVRGELQFRECFSVCDVGSERRAAGCVSVFVTWVVRGELQGVFQCL